MFYPKEDVYDEYDEPKNEHPWHIKPIFANKSPGWDYTCFLTNKTKTVKQWNHELGLACLCGNTKHVNLILVHGHADDWGTGLLYACMIGHQHLVCEMIRLCKRDLVLPFLNMDKALHYACYGNHFDIVKLLINEGAKDWNMGLMGACEGGHLEIASAMIKNGADNFNHGLYFACKGGYLELVNSMIKLGANECDTAMMFACREGHLQIVEFLNSKDELYNWSEFLKQACIGGHINVIHFLQLRLNNINWDACLVGTAIGGHLKLLKAIMFDINAHWNWNWDWNRGLTMACAGGSLELAKFMIQNGATCWNDAFIFVCWTNNGPLAQLIFSRSTVTFGMFQSGFYHACEKQNLDIVELLILHWPDHYKVVESSLMSYPVDNSFDLFKIFLTKGSEMIDCFTPNVILQLVERKVDISRLKNNKFLADLLDDMKVRRQCIVSNMALPIVLLCMLYDYSYL